VKFIGDDADDARATFEKLIATYCGGDAVIQTVGGSVQAVSAVTLVLTISTLFAAPKGIFQQLVRHKQSAFLEHLQHFVRDYNVELILTLPDGRRIDFRTVDVEEVRELLDRLQTN
jgi:hypothetical protein